MKTPEQIEILRRWVKALRSGEFKQTNGWLHKGNHYCCLGVLYEITPGVKRRCSKDGIFAYAFGGGVFHRHYPDTRFFDSTGLSDDFASKLASMNDSGATFAEIAERIEAEYPEIKEV